MSEESDTYEVKKRIEECVEEFQAVTGMVAVSRMEGYVRDTLGQPVDGASVELYRKEDDVLLLAVNGSVQKNQWRGKSGCPLYKNRLQ